MKKPETSSFIVLLALAFFVASVAFPAHGMAFAIIFIVTYLILFLWKGYYEATKIMLLLQLILLVGHIASHL